MFRLLGGCWRNWGKLVLFIFNFNELRLLMTYWEVWGKLVAFILNLGEIRKLTPFALNLREFRLFWGRWWDWGQSVQFILNFSELRLFVAFWENRGKLMPLRLNLKEFIERLLMDNTTVYFTFEITETIERMAGN